MKKCKGATFKFMIAGTSGRKAGWCAGKEPVGSCGDAGNVLLRQMVGSQVLILLLCFVTYLLSTFQVEIICKCDLHILSVLYVSQLHHFFK